MKKIITTIVVALVAAATVQADVLAMWDIEQDMSASTAPVTTVGSGLSSTALDASAAALGTTRIAPGISWPDAVGTFAENWRLSSSIEFALQEDIYYGFTLTPDAGKTLNLDNVFGRFSVNDGGGSADVTFTLMSSQTGFDTNGVLGSLNVTATGTGYNPAVYTADFDLSGEAALQNVATATEFRIYFNSAEGNRMGIGQAWGVAGDEDLRVDGSVIPEPGTLGLLVFASAGMLWFRRRFRI